MHSIVAARAVVTSSFKSNVLIGGIPAKQLNERVFWTRQLNSTEKQESATKEQISSYAEQYLQIIENAKK
tara:strand:+ start:1447 stop:1656 length:210 start_codon:yes stop_codon:yes gene_type:complete